MDKLERLYKRQDWLDANVLCPYQFNCNNDKCKGIICKERKEYMANQQAIKKIEEKAQHRWVISDTHFFHDNIIKYCNRPYENVKKMNADIIKRWNSVVGPNDIIYFLGDFALMYGEKEKIQQVVNMLHGKKIMIQGNHDSRKPNYYSSLGFFVVKGRQPSLFDWDVVLSHEPCPKDKIKPGMYYLFGHVHGTHCELDDLDNCFNVSCEVLNYKPYDIDKLVSKLKAGKKQEVLDELAEERIKFLEEKKND